MRRVAIVLAALLLGLALSAWTLLQLSWGLLGEHEGPGQVTATPVPDAVPGRQILFGDLHVHTTFSTDAFASSLPLMQGSGAHPPADACDYARFCSGLDFWSINDHAENLTPRHWAETVDSIRQCNAVTTPEAPDVVAFLGWEWTQVGQTPERHYGHKNVILRHTDDARIPARPIAAGQALQVGSASRFRPGPGALALIDRDGDRQRYFNFARYMADRAEVPRCPDQHTRSLARDCMEVAETASDLFRKLEEWGGESLVIPHGTTWGFYTPLGSSWDKQLAPGQAGGGRQLLWELYSGHGNTEEYRDWREIEHATDGTPLCPQPTRDYLPGCWRAGRILEERCLAAGEDEEHCAQIAADTRQRYVEIGNRAYRIVPGQTVEDWLDAGQCRDCFLPAFNFRPRQSAQYVLARRVFEQGERRHEARFGFIGSSDGHQARPGTGYKESDRMRNVDGLRFESEAAQRALLGARGDPASYAPREIGALDAGFGTFEIERMASFLTSGGLAAVHAEVRTRDAIWEALQRREVYATSGDRILLYFDLLNPPSGGSLPMGSEVDLGETPRFRVRAAGAFRQRPGCPEHSLSALSAERLDGLCGGECYHPSDTRKLITHIEVIRVRPQVSADEPLADLVEDPWLRHACAPDPAGCVLEFEDPDFAVAGRDTIYYVRALEEPGPVINGDGFGCRYDDAGRCVSIDPCYQDWRTAPDDDCLSPERERAWSSPIWVDAAR